jgi:hypothetical protein
MQFLAKYGDSPIFRISHYTATRSVFMGAGLAYCIQQEKYHHIPLIIIFPSAYAGYHTYKNRDTIMLNTINSIKDINQLK